MQCGLTSHGASQVLSILTANPSSGHRGQVCCTPGINVKSHVWGPALLYFPGSVACNLCIATELSLIASSSGNTSTRSIFMTSFRVIACCKQGKSEPLLTNLSVYFYDRGRKMERKLGTVLIISPTRSSPFFFQHPFYSSMSLCFS